MALSLEDLITPVDEDDVLASILSVANTLGLSTTSWQSGQPSRTILRVVSSGIAATLGIVSTITRGGLLDYAAGVTPEGGPGWLDTLALGFFGLTRTPATYAPTTVLFTTTAASVGGTYPAGTLHVARGSIGYSNTAEVIIPAGAGSVSGAFAADVAGAAGSSGTGTITTMTTVLTGVSCSNTTPAIGADSERNAALVTRCRDRWPALSVDGPSGAYAWHAKNVNSGSDNQVAVTSGPLTAPVYPVTRAKSVAALSTGIVTTYVASASGAYATPPNYTGDASKAIASSTNASPIVVTMGAAHGYTTGDTVQIAGHLVNTAANGNWTIIVTGATTFSLTSSVGNGVGGATGTSYRYSDLDLIDNSIQANAVPLATTAVTVSAAALNVAVTGVMTVTGDAASLSDAELVALATTALDLLASSIPIGGVGTTATLYLEQIRATIWNAIGNPVNVTLSLPAANVALAANQVPVFSPAPSLTVARV